jgi:hypothetical protein
LLQNWVEAQSYWAVLFAKTANAIGLLPEKRDMGNLQQLSLVEEFARIFRAFAVLYQIAGPVGGGLRNYSPVVLICPKIPKKGLTRILFGSIINKERRFLPPELHTSG